MKEGGMAPRDGLKRTMNLPRVMALAMLVACVASAMAQTRQLLKPGVVVKTVPMERRLRCDYAINSYQCYRHGAQDNARRYLYVVQDPGGQAEVIVESQSQYRPGDRVLLVFEPNGDVWIAPPDAMRE